MQARPELAEKSFRQAIAYAIDRQELVDKIERGAAVTRKPGSSASLIMNFTTLAKHLQYTLNTNKAKEHMSNLGYKRCGCRRNPEKQQRWALKLPAVVWWRGARLVEVIKQHLAQAGIEVVINSVDIIIRDARFKDGDFELCINSVVMVKIYPE